MAILKFSVLISLLGIFLLFLISASLSPTEITTQSTLKENQYVKIIGKVVYEKNYNNFKIISIEDNFGTIKAICKTKQKFINKTVEIIGRIKIWKNQTEIDIEKMQTKNA